MAVSEDTIVKVLRLLPDHRTVEGLRETDTLRDVPLTDIYEALHTLEKRGQVKAVDLLGRGIPPQSA